LLPKPARTSRPVDLLARAEIVILMLRDGSAVDAVLDRCGADGERYLTRFHRTGGDLKRSLQ
jgi:hypothetical protein